MHLVYAWFFFSLWSHAASDHALCTTSATSLRESPRASARETWRVGKYMPLLKLSMVNGWYKVRDLDNDEHWVASQNVTHKWSCVVIKSPIAGLRSGPGPEFGTSPIPFADKYTAF